MSLARSVSSSFSESLPEYASRLEVCSPLEKTPLARFSDGLGCCGSREAPDGMDDGDDFGGTDRSPGFDGDTDED